MHTYHTDYFFKVTEATEDEIEVKFMIATREEGVFTWPGTEDVSCEHKEQVLHVLTKPQQMKSSRRHEYFKFKTEELEDARKIFKSREH